MTQFTALLFAVPLLSLLLFRSMHCPLVPLIAILALIAAILALVPTAVHAQNVVHALLSAATGAALLHLLFINYASLILPAVLLFCATLLAIITPSLPPILILLFTLSTLPHSLFLFLKSPLPIPIPSPSSSTGIKGTFADYKSSILPQPCFHSDLESLLAPPPNKKPTFILAAQLSSLLASAFEIPAVVLLSNENSAFASAFSILQSAFTLLCLVLILFAYHQSRQSLSPSSSHRETPNNLPLRTSIPQLHAFTRRDTRFPHLSYHRPPASTHENLVPCRTRAVTLPHLPPPISSLGRPFTYPHPRSRPPLIIPNRTSTPARPSATPAKNKDTRSDISPPTPTHTPDRREEEHDFTDLRDPFATRSPPSGHYILRTSESGRAVGPTRMSAWGRLQLPVRLHLHGTSVGVVSNGGEMDDIQDSALLAQRLLRRLQGYGHAHVGSGSWVGGKYPPEAV